MSDELFSEGASQIMEGIASDLAKAPKDIYVDRASSATRCVRERWLKRRGVEGEPLQPRMALVFKYGHLVEPYYKMLVEKYCVGPGKLYSEVDFGKRTRFIEIDGDKIWEYEQETVITKIGELSITGHCDGWGRRNSDGEWEIMDFKSAANIGYDKFVAGEIPDYERQLTTLLLSEKNEERKAKSFRLWYWRKETEHLFDRPFTIELEVIKKVKREFIIAAGEAEPAPPYELTKELVYNRSTKSYDETGRLIIPNYPCGYCAFKAHCFSDVSREFKSGKPVWVYTPKKVSVG